MIPYILDFKQNWLAEIGIHNLGRFCFIWEYACINKQPFGPWAADGDREAGWPSRKTSPLWRGVLRNVFVYFWVYKDWRKASAGRTHVNRTHVGTANWTPNTRQSRRYIHPTVATLIFWANTSTEQSTGRWMHYKDMQMVHSINRQAEIFFRQSTVLVCAS